MKTSINTALFALICVVLTGCVGMGRNIEPSKKTITRDYEVTGFNKIDISTVTDVYYTQSTDSQTTLRINGPENFVELINVKIEDNTLSLYFEKKVSFNSKKLVVHVSTPQLEGIKFKGVGDIFIAKGFSSEEFNIESKGVGNIEADSVTCGQITINSSGVGDVKVAGTAKKAFLSSKGVGDIDAKNLQAAYVEASSKGVGNISCYASETIDASVKGVGSINYRGNPSTQNVEKKGVGSVKAID